MGKFISIFSILSLFAGSIGLGQSVPFPSSIGNEIGSIQNLETFINRKLINPTNLTDSNSFLIDVTIHEQWVGNFKATKGFFLSGENGIGSKWSIGANIDFKINGLFQHRSIISSVKYKWRINDNSGFELGLNMGYWQYRVDLSSLLYSQDPMLDNSLASEWQNRPIVDLGINYKFKTQSIRVSYNNFVIGSNFPVFRGLILNYQNIYTVSQKIALIPDIYVCMNSEKTYGILMLNLVYSKKVTCGVLYNTGKSFGFQVSGNINRKVKIGYIYNRANIDNLTFNSHSLNLGYIINKRGQ
jgi:hypothetical protein